MIALGSPAVGLSGFRDTHHQALQAQRLVHVAGAGAGPVTAYDDQWVRAAAILGADLEQTRMLVRSTLGSAIGPRAQPIHGGRLPATCPAAGLRGQDRVRDQLAGSARRLRTTVASGPSSEVWSASCPASLENPRRHPRSSRFSAGHRRRRAVGCPWQVPLTT